MCSLLTNFWGQNFLSAHVKFANNVDAPESPRCIHRRQSSCWNVLTTTYLLLQYESIGIHENWITLIDMTYSFTYQARWICVQLQHGHLLKRELINFNSIYYIYLLIRSVKCNRVNGPQAIKTIIKSSPFTLSALTLWCFPPVFSQLITLFITLTTPQTPHNVYEL